MRHGSRRTHLLLSACLVLATGLSALPARADDCLDYGATNPTLLYGGDGITGTAIATQGDRAWVGVSGGLRTYDISDPTTPVALGTLPLAGGISDLVVDGDWLYICVSNYGLRIASLASGPLPQLVAGVPLGGYTTDAEVSGGVALVAGTGGSLVVCDVSDPAQPQVLATVPCPAASAVLRVGDMAYVAGRAAGVLPVDVGDPSAPAAAPMLDVGADVIGLREHGGVLYAATYDGRLLALDVADPPAPTLAGALALPDFATSLSVREGALWLTVCNTGLVKVDTSAPLAPAVADLIELPGLSYDVAHTGGVSLVAGKGDLRVVDPDEQRPQASQGWFRAPSGFGAVAFAGDRAFGLDYFEGLLTLDVTDPLHPVETARLPLGGDQRAIALGGGHAFVAAGLGGLHAIDLADPDQPTLALTMFSGASVRDVEKVGDLLLVSKDAAGVETLSVLDATDWQAPATLGAVTVYGAGEISVAGTRALVSKEGGVALVDFAQPAMPTVLGTWTAAGGVSGHVLAGSVAWVAVWGAGVYALDLTDPALPQVIATWNDSPWVDGLTLDAGVLYAVSMSDGVFALDVRDPYHPLLVDAISLAGAEEGLVVAGGTLFAITGEHGLTMTGPACLDQAAGVAAVTPRRLVLSASPNPFNPRTTIAFTLDAATEVAIDVHDVRGRHVRALLAPTRLGAGPHAQAWDGRDDAGRPVPGGVYLASVRHGAARERVKLTLLK
ncbi:MAG: hypothetical protein IPK64_00865 [bacterium]|nr:hypothetical protein [bacterium]